LAFISPSSTNPQVTRSGYLEINRLVGRNDGNGAAGAAFAQDQDFKSVFVVRNDNDFANEIAAAFKSQANRLGLKIVGDSVASIEAGNLEATANALMKAKADMVYFSGPENQAGAFFKQARLAGYTGALMTIEGSPTLIDSSGPLAIEGGGLYYTDTAAPISTYPEAAIFMQEFQAEYGVSPQPYAAEAYDAAGICLKAIEEASKAIGGELPSRLQVANAIRALKDYLGITGTYNFNNKGDPAPAKYFVYKVVSPDPSNWGQNILIATIESSTP
jgi:branched-chain amino acid transport system substrate-binding protein